MNDRESISNRVDELIQLQKDLSSRRESLVQATNCLYSLLVISVSSIQKGSVVTVLEKWFCANGTS